MESKDSDTKDMQDSREVSGFSRQLLLTKYLGPYGPIISSSLISLTYLLSFAALVYTILNTIIIYQS